MSYNLIQVILSLCLKFIFLHVIRMYDALIGHSNKYGVDHYLICVVVMMVILRHFNKADLHHNVSFGESERCPLLMCVDRCFTYIQLLL